MSVGKEERINKAENDLGRVLEASDYWRLRASLGDVDRAQADVERAQQRLMELMKVRQDLLQKAAGVGVDINFVSSVDWDDTKLLVTFRRVTAPPKPLAFTSD